ncbi:MAG: hypothetical protein LBT01_06180 [Spirochaetaceae bacterium]|nr:hypothetical protein [Spirochaetaceae bacterium]
MSAVETDDLFVVDANEIEKMIRKHRRAQKKSLRAGVPLWAKSSVHAKVWTIPLPPKKEVDERPPQKKLVEFVLDKKLIKELRRDTEDIAEVLCEIFTADEESGVETIASIPQNDNLLGLDDAFSTLLKTLLTKGSWQREEWETLAKQCGLMPDGAIEAINEKAFDTYDEPLIEDGLELTINDALIKKTNALFTLKARHESASGTK